MREDNPLEGLQRFDCATVCDSFSPISKKESRRKGSSSNFLHSLRLPSFRMPGTSSSHNPHEAASSSELPSLISNTHF